MSYWQIVKCRICGKLFRIYMHQVYEGDPSCCPECNQKSEGKIQRWAGT